jgi:hypothetical protein
MKVCGVRYLVQQGTGQEKLEAELVFGALAWSEDLVVD